MWALPLYLVIPLSIEKNKVQIFAGHVIFVDVCTDITMFMTTVIGGTYVGHIYICFDIGLKINNVRQLNTSL